MNNGRIDADELRGQKIDATLAYKGSGHNFARLVAVVPLNFNSITFRLDRNGESIDTADLDIAVRLYNDARI